VLGLGKRWQPPVLVVPASPTSFDHDDFAALTWALFERTDYYAHDIQVQLGYHYGDAWDPSWTWITVALDEGARTAVDAIAAGIVAWGIDWLRRKRKTEPDVQPIKAIIYGPRGEVLREVEVPDKPDQ
jgi:hypothetical protein